MKIGHFTEQDVLNLAKKALDEGKAKFEIVPEKCTLLVIDVQDEFVKPQWAPDWVLEANRQVPRIKRLIENCRGKNIPVIYSVYSKIHHYHDRPKTGKFMPGLYSEFDIDFSHFFLEGQV
jgi:nicotinamidase-related amidase